MKELTKNIALLCWEGYEQLSFRQRFSAVTGIGLTASTLISDYDAAQKVLNAESDIAVLNINNPYPKKLLYPQGKVLSLESDRLPTYKPIKSRWLKDFEQWGYSDQGEMIGICQRFGSFNMVINNRKISSQMATAEGFNLPDATEYKVPYGILLFPEFNIFHICIAAGINPFQSIDHAQLELFEEKAREWFSQSTLVTDNNDELNRALIDGRIDFYLSGGTFVAGAARLEGFEQVECITPESGPIDGKGAISFVEVTSLTSQLADVDSGYQYLDYILQPENAANIASNPNVCNPILQMEQEKVFAKLSNDFLRAIQWDSLESDIVRCAQYDIPPNFPQLLERYLGNL